MSVLIKNFGNNRTCLTQQELEKTINDHYVGKSISLVVKGKIIFADVQENGALIDSYNKNNIDYSSLNLPTS